jgi:hypothetical protein
MNQINLYNLENKKQLVVQLTIIPRIGDLIDLCDEKKQKEFADNCDYLLVERIILYVNNHTAKVLVSKVINKDK